MLISVHFVFVLGLALRTKSTPDVKEAYGKIKKEENVTDDGKRPNVQSSAKQKPLVVKFNNVAFVEEHGERFWFFKTHVIPGNSIHLQNCIYFQGKGKFSCLSPHLFIICEWSGDVGSSSKGLNKHCKLPVNSIHSNLQLV